MSARSASRSMSPLKSARSCGLFPRLAHQVHRLRPRMLHVRPRRVEMRVGRHHLPLPPRQREQNLLRRPSLVHRDDVLEPRQRPHRLLKAVETPRPRVGLVPVHHARPLPGAHRRRPAVRQQIDHHILRPHQERIVKRLLQNPLPLFPRREPDRLHTLDPERLDDRLHGKDIPPARPPKSSPHGTRGKKTASRPLPAPSQLINLSCDLASYFSSYLSFLKERGLAVRISWEAVFRGKRQRRTQGIGKQ